MLVEQTPREEMLPLEEPDDTAERAHDVDMTNP